MDIGTKIKTIRMQKRMTQQKLAEECNISNSTISSIERGITDPSLIVLCNIAKALGIASNELVDFDVSSIGFYNTVSGSGILTADDARSKSNEVNMNSPACKEEIERVYNEIRRAMSKGLYRVNVEIKYSYQDFIHTMLIADGFTWKLCMCTTEVIWKQLSK